MIAKHLEHLKGGKIPVEILVTTKDAEQKAKVFEKCLDVIKSAGVGRLLLYTQLIRPNLRKSTE